MSRMSELALHRSDGRDGVDVGDLNEIALALGGEVDGRAVLAPSPGRPAGDRSMVVFIDPTRPQSFFIYGCDGPLYRARNLVREKLKLVTPVIAPSFERTATALRIWKETVPAEGTAVMSYLRSRAIDLAPLPTTLRFHPALRHGPSGGTWPAMVTVVTDTNDRPVAIHRTYIRHDGRGKAPVEPDKMTLGPISGNAIHLAAAAAVLLVGEGIETCLSAMQATGRPAWSAISAVGLRKLNLPPAVCEVIILADGDDAGEAAALAAAARWIGQGRRARIARAPAGKDFNDILIEESA
jgi:hypothetical protein